jgi:hypothetical protein
MSDFALDMVSLLLRLKRQGYLAGMSEEELNEILHDYPEDFQTRIRRVMKDG